ncbi:hypothetical protein HNY73_009952 [Argiope bruennichi]|uniref:Uncharacterized protein n=1 Tax=Argiope bruennichi TaxID=94029 RepID=A0A8T0F6U9_ARGBR|nr:hypothetical protein HNY73_009952 [Argiope bruennichi]
MAIDWLVFKSRESRIMSNRVEIRKKARDIEPWELRQILQDPSSDILDDVDAKLQKGHNRIIVELELKHKKPQNDFINKPSLPKLKKSFSIGFMVIWSVYIVTPYGLASTYRLFSFYIPVFQFWASSRALARRSLSIKYFWVS